METALFTNRHADMAIRTEVRGQLTARQALIRATLSACLDSPGGIWPAPLGANEILLVAEGVAGRAYSDLAAAFQALITEGLFFEVHHGLFDTPVYYCTYDSRFLRELPQGNSREELWEGLSKAMDDRFGPTTWRSLGLCAGQGRADGSLGPCLGATCPQTRENTRCCFRGLAFSKGLLVPCPGCGQDTVREELADFISPIHFQLGQASFRPCVCEQCIDSREALLQLGNQEYGQPIDWARTLEAFQQALGQTID